MIHRKLALLFVLMPTVALAADPVWLRITVQEKGYTEPNVKVNVPLSLLEVVADAVKTEELSLDGIVKEATAEIQKEGIDLPKLWEGLQKLGPTDFIEIQDKTEHVKVWKDTKDFKITVTEQGQAEPKVLVTFPLAIVAEIIGDGKTPITFKGILAELKKAGPMQFVEIHDQGDHVRIWLE